MHVYIQTHTHTRNKYTELWIRVACGETERRMRNEDYSLSNANMPTVINMQWGNVEKLINDLRGPCGRPTFGASPWWATTMSRRRKRTEVCDKNCDCAWYCGCSFTFWTVGLGYSLKNLHAWWRPQVSFGSMLIGWRKQWLKRSGKNAIATWYCRSQGTGRGWEGIVSSEGGAAAERPKESIISTQQYMSIFRTQFLELKVSPPCNDLFFWDLRCQKNTTKYCS